MNDEAGTGKSDGEHNLAHIEAWRGYVREFRRCGLHGPGDEEDMHPELRQIFAEDDGEV